MSWRPGSAGIEPGQLKTGSCTTKMFDQKRAKSLVHTHISSSPGTTNHPSPPLLLLLLSVVVVVVLLPDVVGLPVLEDTEPEVEVN